MPIRLCCGLRGTLENLEMANFFVKLPMAMVVNVVVAAAVVVDGLVLDVEQLGLEEVHGPGLVQALLLLLLLLRPLIDLVLVSPLVLLLRDELGAPLLPD